MALIQSINYIHEAKLQFKEKQTHAQEIIFQKQLEYFKVQHMKMNRTQKWVGLGFKVLGVWVLNLNPICNN